MQVHVQAIETNNFKSKNQNRKQIQCPVCLLPLSESVSVSVSDSESMSMSVALLVYWSLGQAMSFAAMSLSLSAWMFCFLVHSRRHPIVHDGRKLQYAVENTPEVFSIEELCNTFE